MINHFWPRRADQSSRSIGTVYHDQCNNCLAVRVWSEWPPEYREDGNYPMDGNRILFNVSQVVIIEDASGTSVCKPEGN